MTHYPDTSGGWLKHPASPILGDETTGTLFDICVLKDDGFYSMYISWRPKKSLAVATSTDGVTWTDMKVVFGPESSTGWEDDINRPAVVKRDGTYHLWYTGQANGHSSIGYATSPDGIHWTRTSDRPVLAPEAPWEKVAVMCPHVIWDKDEALFKMWYSGGEQYEPDAIGYATSPDGTNWTRHPSNPIFGEDPRNAWESMKVTACQVEKVDGRYLMFYVGFENIDTARIGIAQSPNGVTEWERCKHNPILSPTEGAWDGEACYKPFAVCDGSKWLLWYNGSNRFGDKRPEYLGFATHDGLDLGI